MRRAHHGTPGETALMAVITKAMGAFLILMILLMPYYRSDPTNAPAVNEMRRSVDQAVEQLKAASRPQAGQDPQELMRYIQTALAQLEQAGRQIGQLKASLDQAASMVARLESELDRAKAQAAEAANRVAQLQSELDSSRTAAAKFASEADALRQENATLRDQHVAPMIFEAMLLGCGQDDLDLLLLPSAANGNLNRAADLSPWRYKPDSHPEALRPARASHGPIQGMAAVDSLSFAISPGILAAGIDVFLRQAGSPEQYQQRMHRVSAVIPDVVKRNADQKVAAALVQRLAVLCNVAFKVVDNHQMSSVPAFPISLFMPVTYAGTLALDADRKLTRRSDSAKTAAFEDTVLRELCNRAADECDIARLLNGRPEAPKETTPEAKAPPPG